MGTVILLVGPKGVGKTWVAEILSSTLGIACVDADLLILELQGAGHQPDGGHGRRAGAHRPDEGAHPPAGRDSG